MKMAPLKRKRRTNRNTHKGIKRANCLPPRLIRLQPPVKSRKGPALFTKTLQSMKLKRTHQ